MNRSGHADLPLHHGKVPPWLAQRMSRLGSSIVEVIVSEYGKEAFLARISDPMWFQSFGAVLGMDWHSSGMTTSVMGALKSGLRPKAGEMGIFVCGGRGKHSRKTPDELIRIADHTGLDGNELVRASKLSAKVDSVAVQDGFQLYLHSFIVTREGQWAVVQQGMNTESRYARRYHWHSPSVASFTSEPHAAVCGENQGKILNLVHKEALKTQEGLLDITRENPDRIKKELRKMALPAHHEVRPIDVNPKRLNAILTLAHEQPPRDFESLLLLKGCGPRTLQSLTLVSEVIHGTPSRFEDPARFSFAHGGKDGHPFPVPTRTYDEVIETLDKVVNKAHIAHTEKQNALKRLHQTAQRLENREVPPPLVNDQIAKEWEQSPLFGGRTVMDDKRKKGQGDQLKLF
jgi:hypothetical protein